VKQTNMAVIYSDQQENAKLPFIVVKLPDVSATDEQCIDDMHCHDSPLTFALLAITTLQTTAHTCQKTTNHR